MAHRTCRREERSQNAALRPSRSLGHHGVLGITRSGLADPITSLHSRGRFRSLACSPSPLLPMRVFEIARRPSDWIRAVLAVLVLAFALNTIAHAAHAHDSVGHAVTHHVACGYCAAFGGGMADAPSHAGTVIAVFTSRVPAPTFIPVPELRLEGNIAQPRAPPAA